MRRPHATTRQHKYATASRHNALKKKKKNATASRHNASTKINAMATRHNALTQNMRRLTHRNARVDILSQESDILARVRYPHKSQISSPQHSIASKRKYHSDGRVKPPTNLRFGGRPILSGQGNPKLHRRG
jgi:hypothetical protein